MKSVRVNFSPGSAVVAEVEAPRAVLLLELLALLLRRGRQARAVAGSIFSGRVTDMSVPTPVSGSRTFSWAPSRPVGAR